MFPDDEELIPPENGVFVGGLVLEGAQWDYESKGLRDNLPTESWSLLHIAHFKPCLSKNLSYDGRYMCPVYCDTDHRVEPIRANGYPEHFIMHVPLEAKGNQDYWIMRGVSLTCSRLAGTISSDSNHPEHD